MRDGERKREKERENANTHGVLSISVVLVEKESFGVRQDHWEWNDHCHYYCCWFCWLPLQYLHELNEGQHQPTPTLNVNLFYGAGRKIKPNLSHNLFTKYCSKSTLVTTCFTIISPLSLRSVTMATEFLLKKPSRLASFVATVTSSKTPFFSNLNMVLDVGLITYNVNNSYAWESSGGLFRKRRRKNILR